MSQAPLASRRSRIPSGRPAARQARQLGVRFAQSDLQLDHLEARLAGGTGCLRAGVRQPSQGRVDGDSIQRVRCKPGAQRDTGRLTQQIEKGALDPIACAGHRGGVAIELIEQRRWRSTGCKPRPVG